MKWNVRPKGLRRLLGGFGAVPDNALICFTFLLISLLFFPFESCYVAQTDLEPIIPQTHCSDCWVYRHVLPYLMILWATGLGNTPRNQLQLWPVLGKDYQSIGGN